MVFCKYHALQPCVLYVCKYHSYFSFLRSGSSDIYSLPEGKNPLAKAASTPTYVNTQHMDVRVLVALQGEADSVMDRPSGEPKDSPRKDIFDMSKKHQHHAHDSLFHPTFHHVKDI